MNIIQIGSVVVLLLIPFLGTKIILDRATRNYLQKNMYLSVMKFILFVIGLMVLLTLLNVDVLVKSAVVTYVAFAGTVYLGLIFQRTYFQHSEVLSQKIKEYEEKKRR